MYHIVPLLPQPPVHPSFEHMLELREEVAEKDQYKRRLRMKLA